MSAPLPSYLIPSPLCVALLNYLADRPWKETNALIVQLQGQIQQQAQEQAARTQVLADAAAGKVDPPEPLPEVPAQ